MMAWWGLLFAALAASTSQTGLVAPPSATVTGVVVDATTDSPLAFAYVQLAEYRGVRSLSATSGSDGAFVFTGVANGTYSLSVQKPGRPLVFYRSTGAPAFEMGELIEVGSGSRIVGLRMEVPRGAVITGRVLDIDGQPAVSSYLILRQSVHLSFSGSPRATVSTVYTNVKGEYRLWGLPPGEYTLSASQDFDMLRRRYAHVYYPGVTDASLSEIISLAPGDERTGVNLRLVEASTTKVDGFALGVDGLPPASASVALWPRDERAVPGTYSVPSRPDGSFSLPAVTEGEYWLGARTGSSTSGSTDGVTWALMSVSVRGRSVSGLSLALQPGGAVKGQLVVDDEARVPANVSGLWVTAMPSHAVFGVRPVDSAVTNTGEFEFRGLVGGRYHVSVRRERYGPPVTIRGLTVNGAARAEASFEVVSGGAASDLTMLVLVARP